MQRFRITLSFLLVILMGLPQMTSASDLDPTASFYMTPSSGSINSTFTFDASASYDQRGFSSTLEYRWKFDYSGGSFTDWSDDQVITYQYSEADAYTVVLEVRDEDGRTDQTYGYLNVYEDEIYSGWFDVNPLEGDTNTLFTFEGDVASKGSVSTSDYQFRWDFDGDGTYDTDYSYGDTSTYTYPEYGIYNPRLEILSPDGTTIEIIGYDDDDDDQISYVHVSLESGYPQASMTAYPTSGTTNTIFYFDSSKSSDSEDHHDLEYRWDFEGDGLFELDWSEDETSPTYQYETPGTYTPTVQIRDSDGYTDEASYTITITSNNLAPEAEFTINTDSGLSDETLGTTDTIFSFNAGRSSDEEDYTSALQVRWDFDGDGDYDTSFSTEKQADHTYLDAGTYTVTLEVIDTEGATDTTDQTITIVINDAPVATFEVSPTKGTPGILFYFDASDVWDSQYKSTSLEVRWDFEGDGTYDTDFERDKTVSHQYDNAGTYEAMAQVRDPEGKTSTYSVTIEVESSTDPVAELDSDETKGTFSTLFHFDAGDSYDGETDFDDLYFRWDFNYTGQNDIQYDTSWSRSETKTHYFDQTGEVVVRVEVKDADEEISSALLTIDIHFASEYMDYLKDEGILRGYSGDLAPDQNVTRAELLKMAMEGADIDQYGHTYIGYFWDVERTDWHDSYVEKAYESGIITGYNDGGFHPNSAITRAEALKIILEAFDVELISYEYGIFPDVSASYWFADYVATAYEYGLISGKDTRYFEPNEPMTRAEASKIIALAMQGL